MGTKAESTVPVGRNHIIERPRLTRLLDETSARVILLVAPAGYGKTTLARQWMRTHPHAWVRLTPACIDVASLAATIALALSKLSGSGSSAIAGRLRTSPNPADEVDALADLQKEELTGWPTNAWLVLDEYEWIAGCETSERYV